MGSECPYCGNDRGKRYYCAHCSAPKEFIEKSSIIETFEDERIMVETLVAESLIEKEAENIIEQTVVAMDVVQETFAEYKKPTTRGRRSGSPTQALVGMALIMLVMMAVLGSDTLMRPVFTEPLTPGDNIVIPTHVYVYVVIVNNTDGSFYTGYAHFSGEIAGIWCTYGSGTQEQGYDLQRIFRTGEVISVCIDEVYVPWLDDVYSFTIPMNWSGDLGAYHTTLHIE